MTKDEALKLALEALKYPLNQSHENFNVDMAELLAHRAITAIEEALMSHSDGAQPEQEPVAFINVEQRKLEWAKYMTWDTPTVVNLPKIPLYTTPPQRKPLTDEEVLSIVHSIDPSHQYLPSALKQLARAIEAAIWEKQK